MFKFLHTHPDLRQGPAQPEPFPPAADFRSSTLQPDPVDAGAWLLGPAATAPVRARPPWLVPALVTTVLVLTLAAGLLAWTWH